MEQLGCPDPGPRLMAAGPADARKAEGDEAAAGGDSKLFRCAWVRRWLPLAYRGELEQVLRLTGPLVSPDRCNVLRSSCLKWPELSLCGLISRLTAGCWQPVKQSLFVPAAAVQDPQLLASIRYHHICWTHWQRGAGWIRSGLRGRVSASVLVYSAHVFFC